MKKLIFLTGLLVAGFSAMPQQTITLQDCYDKAKENHPIGLQKAELEKIIRLNQDITASFWLPQNTFNAQATYQSDVITIGMDLPGFDFPSPTRDQYRMSAEVQQIIYDGGQIKQKRNLNEAQHLAEIQNIEVQVYQVLTQVNHHFFRHFILAENLKVMDLTLEEITQQLNAVKSGVENGTLLPSNQWALEAELLQLQQKRDEWFALHTSNLEILEILTNADLKDKNLVLPDEMLHEDKPLNRPEVKLFNLQKESLHAASRLTATSRRPRVSTFAQVGYGRPGLNMLSEDFEFFYLAGIRVSWNLWDWKRTYKQRQIQQVKTEMVDHQQQLFKQKTNIALTAVTALISQLEETAQKDLEIISLREQILEGARSQLQNGVITSTEYLQQLNALARARIQHQTNQIRLIQARAEYNTIRGNHN